MTRDRLATICDAHRLMMGRMIKESSFEAVLQLVADECGGRSGLSSTSPTIKQRRYRGLAATLSAALDAATLGRI